MKRVSAVLLFLLLIIPEDVNSRHEFRPRRQFAGDTVSSFLTDSKHGGAAALPFTVQDCKEEPKIEHATVHCAYSGCRVLCDKDYKIVDQNTRSLLAFTTLQCDHSTGQLTLDGQPWQQEQVSCGPSCGLDGCYNGGSCVGPRQCECATGFSGDHCEIPPEDLPAPSPEPDTCPEPDFPIVNAEVTRSGEQLVVRCNSGNTFKIGGTIAFIQCRDGDWDHPKGIFSEGGALTCEETQCDPPCLNGGVCLPEGVCDCPYKYWGSACQQIRCPYPDSALLSHASLGGIHSRMKIQCHPRYKMSSGRRSQTILCRHGEWVLPGRGLLKNNDVKCYPGIPEMSVQE